MSLLLLFKYSEETLRYFNLKKVEANRKNQVLGGMKVNGDIYCREDIDKYHINWSDLKNITYRHTLSSNYVCIKCGYKITLKTFENRYQHINKIGRRRYN